MREAPRYSLSRYEQGERDAIVSALREAGGNKARAADILGIGRTTLVPQDAVAEDRCRRTNDRSRQVISDAESARWMAVRSRSARRPLQDDASRDAALYQLVQRRVDRGGVERFLR